MPVADRCATTAVEEKDASFLEVGLRDCVEFGACETKACNRGVIAEVENSVGDFVR